MQPHDIPDTPECFRSHMGAWAIEPTFLETALAQVQNGTFKPQQGGDGDRSGVGSYQLLDGGIAVVPILGAMQKGSSKYGGCSTVKARRQLRSASRDEEVNAILLHVDSPGGTAVGTYEFSEDVKAAAAVKPVYAQVSDQAASAALFAIAHATEISANAPAELGSVGTIAYLYDTSKKFEKDGVRLHAITTGAYKAVGLPGREVTESDISYVTEIVERHSGFFVGALQQGRGLTEAQVKELTDGRMFSVERAQELGILDTVRSMDETLEMIRSKHSPKEEPAGVEGLSQTQRLHMETEIELHS